jgi:hypothetical protein
MGELEQKIRVLAKEIQALEQTLVEECGMPAVTPANSTVYGPQLASRPESVYRRICDSVARLFETDVLVVRAPQPD